MARSNAAMTAILAEAIRGAKFGPSGLSVAMIKDVSVSGAIITVTMWDEGTLVTKTLTVA